LQGSNSLLFSIFLESFVELLQIIAYICALLTQHYTLLSFSRFKGLLLHPGLVFSKCGAQLEIFLALRGPTQ